MDFEKYYDFRWRMLRKPWHQPEGSEKDELENVAIHRMILDQANQVIAVGRLHIAGENSAQIRYMAVSPDHKKQGLGNAILHSLEQAAAMNTDVQSLFLHARENAVAFYEKHGYKIEKASHLLYGDIQHFLMKKII